MGPEDSLKKIGEQVQDAASRVFGRAREQWEDAERRIRASMRIHPRPKRNASEAKVSFTVQSSASAHEGGVGKKDVA